MNYSQDRLSVCIWGPGIKFRTSRWLSVLSEPLNKLSGPLMISNGWVVRIASAHVVTWPGAYQVSIVNHWVIFRAPSLFHLVIWCYFSHSVVLSGCFWHCPCITGNMGLPMKVLEIQPGSAACKCFISCALYSALLPDLLFLLVIAWFWVHTWQCSRLTTGESQNHLCCWGSNSGWPRERPIPLKDLFHLPSPPL